MKTSKRMDYFRLIIFIVLIAFYATTTTTTATTDTQSNCLVDQLIEDYLKAEKQLWTVIEKREDSTLQQIYNVHTDFLNRHYSQSNILFNEEFTRNNPKIIANVIAINETSVDIAREFFEHRNYSVLSMKALNGITLDELFNIISEETINSTDFWLNVKNVSCYYIQRYYIACVLLCAI